MIITGTARRDIKVINWHTSGSAYGVNGGQSVSKRYM
jgi:hypothetical protein